MSNGSNPEDRSMSEILASIRRIVSDEEKARREAETSRRTHEKSAGESVLTLTPDMKRSESLSDALGVEPVDEAADTDTATVDVAPDVVSTPAPESGEAGRSDSGSVHELPPLELGEADRAPAQEEPLILRRSAMRRGPAVTDDAPDAPETVRPAPIRPAPAAKAPAKDVEPDPQPEPEAPAPVLQEEPPASVESTVVEETPEAAATPDVSEPEPVAEATTAPEPQPEPVKDIKPAERAAPEIKREAPPAVGVSAPVEAAPDDGLLDDDFLPEPLMTEAEVEAIVRRVVREELQGPIGQQISRKVKRMIKDEIRKALYDDDSLI